MPSPPKPWCRTTRARPCPVCGGLDCLYAGPSDAPAAVVCRNVSSPWRTGDAGHLHVLDDRSPTWAPWRRSLVRLGGGGRP
jgi:hypothetical protein